MFADRAEVRSERMSSGGQRPDDATTGTKRQWLVAPPGANVLVTLLLIALWLGCLAFAVRAVRRHLVPPA
jgi:hypothetical protein